MEVSKEERNPDENTLMDNYRLAQIYSYANFREKIPDPSPRKILFSSTFSCSVEYQDGLHLLMDKILKGQNLLPHLSRHIFNPDAQDGMLFDFGIFHLHLGLKPDSKKPLLVKGTKDIVYSVFDDDFAYFLVIDDHGRWADIDLLRIIQKDFPKLLSRWELNILGSENTMSETERIELRKAGISTHIELDGSFYMSPGGGINTAGTSTNSVLKMQKTIKFYRSIQTQVKDILEKRKDEFQKSIGQAIDELNLRMVDSANYIFEDAKLKSS